MRNHQNEKQNARSNLRQKIRLRRSQLSLTEREASKRALLEVLTSTSIFTESKRVALYLTNDGELDTSLVIDYCWHNNIEVFLPVIHPFSKGHLLFLKYDSSTPMTTNRFGIKEPKLNVNELCLLEDLDIIFTPLVAFDESGERLGMGGGFYDRTLAISKLQGSVKNKHELGLFPLAIGLAFDCQRVTKIPTESWDIPIPLIATPSKLYRF